MNVHPALVAAAAALGIALVSAGSAHAQPLLPDPSQPANGVGYEHARYLTPAWSPIQVPAPTVIDTPDGATTLVTHPFLSHLVHEIVPVPAHTAVELRGAVRLSLPGLGAHGGALVINPNGHCLFAGVGAIAARGARLAPVLVDTPAFQLIIEPTLYR